MVYSLAIQNLHKFFTFKDFNNYNELRDYHLSIPNSAHYEIIHGIQCLYFDFDGSSKTTAWTANNIKETLDILVKSILDWFGTCANGIPIKIMVYSSSDSTAGVREECLDKLKTSYHVVVKGACFVDHVACGSVAKAIVKDNETLEPAFDASVYTSKRNLRMLGSRKVDSSRIKVFHSSPYESPGYKCRYIMDPLYMSLVSGTIDCKLVEVAVQQKHTHRNISSLTPVEVTHMLEVLSGYVPNTFDKREVKGKMLVLNRLKPGECPVCCRIHTNDNATMVLRHDGIYFICYRDTSNPIRLDGPNEEVYVDEIVTKRANTGETAHNKNSESALVINESKSSKSDGVGNTNVEASECEGCDKSWGDVVESVVDKRGRFGVVVDGDVELGSRVRVVSGGDEMLLFCRGIVKTYKLGVGFMSL
jgi:hypothetical protein